MSEERLYQPDFKCIFGNEYANAFYYGRVDSLVWPIFEDIEMSEKLKKLLSMKNQEGRNYFYCRKITLEDVKLEFECSDIQIALIQGMELNKDHGIDNEDVINVVSKDKNLFKGILSFDPRNPDTLEKLKSQEKEIPVAGIVLYPSQADIDLTDTNDNLFHDFLIHCQQKKYFIKIDLGNTYLPQIYTERTGITELKTLISTHPQNIFILSGLDISGDYRSYYQLLKTFNNAWLELDPRCLGGMTPTDLFNTLFKTKGFIQNAWYKMQVGSATPTLEISQMMRGFLEASEQLAFSQKMLLRTWMFRNVNRVSPSIFTPLVKDLELYKTLLEVKHLPTSENENEVNLLYQLKLRSYSITQLLFLTDIIKTQLNEALEKYPSLKHGELFMRTYHTTTTFINNEHEWGNYLDLHYKFAEISKYGSENFLHTVRALENRADFNHYDHELASTYGTKQMILPIVNRKLEIGSREQFYVLVTFGPRTFNLFIKIKLLKENSQ